MDTTVNSNGMRVQNLGAMADRRNGIIFSGILVILGIGLVVAGEKVKIKLNEDDNYPY